MCFWGFFLVLCSCKPDLVRGTIHSSHTWTHAGCTCVSIARLFVWLDANVIKYSDWRHPVCAESAKEVQRDFSPLHPTPALGKLLRLCWETVSTKSQRYLSCSSFWLATFLYHWHHLVTRQKTTEAQPSRTSSVCWLEGALFSAHWFLQSTRLPTCKEEVW